MSTSETFGKGIGKAVIASTDDAVVALANNQQTSPGIVDAINTAATVGGVGVPMVANLALPALGGILGAIGLKGMQNKLGAPARYLDSTKITKNISVGTALMEGSFVAMSGVEMYRVASSFTDKMESLKQMYADLTGKNPRRISTWSLLTADKVPPIVADARSHIIKEHGLRGILSSIGGIVSLRSMLGKGGKWASGIFMGAQLGSVGVDFLMGEAPLLQIYKGLSDKSKQGQLTAQDRAVLLVSASEELRKRGNVGMQFAQEIVGKYYANNATPAGMLKDVANGKLMQHVHDLINTHKVVHPAAAHNGHSMVDKISNKTNPHRPTVGTHTAKFNHDEKIETPPTLAV